VSIAAPPTPTANPATTSPSAERQKPRQGSQGVFCIWHGLNASMWKRLQRSGLPKTREYFWRRCSISALSRWNSIQETLETLLYGRAIDRVEIRHPPVFVLGHWRSGTTLLHNWMTLDPQFTFPNLYQTLFPGHFLLSEWLATRLTGWMVPSTRPMDNVSAGWSLPQEDEMAMLLRTLVSPYLMIGFQGQPARYERYFDLTDLSTDELASWIHEFRRFLQKISYRCDRPIVVKSPSHTYRIPLLLELFPQAKFVYIYRDPYAVYSSTAHLRRMMFSENALATPNFAGSEDDQLRWYLHAFDRYESTKSMIPAGQLHEVRFEDLEAQPLLEMQRLYEGLGFSGWAEAEQRLKAELPAHDRYRKNRFQMDEATMRRVYSACRRVFDTYGYPSRLPADSDERAA
jgi:omega-hydroxy-beta-dihydromenaquinone-9 sulfotransferase